MWRSKWESIFPFWVQLYGNIYNYLFLHCWHTLDYIVLCHLKAVAVMWACLKLIFASNGADIVKSDKKDIKEQFSTIWVHVLIHFLINLMNRDGSSESLGRRFFLSDPSNFLRVIEFNGSTILKVGSWPGVSTVTVFFHVPRFGCASQRPYRWIFNPQRS